MAGNVADSMLDQDGTLPVDIEDGSFSFKPGHLPDISIGPQLPHMACYTMKEYEQKLSELKKENFNLKLRIYFLEEKQPYNFDGESGQLIRANIELNVTVQELKNELQEKQELLKKASLALNTVTEQQESDLRQTQEDHQKALNDLRKQNDQLHLDLATCQEQLASCQEELAACQQELSNQKDSPITVLKEKVQKNVIVDDDCKENKESDESIPEGKRDKSLERVLLEEKEKIIDDLEKRLEDATNTIKTHTENALKRDKAIQGLAKVLMQKDAEIAALQGDKEKLSNKYQGQKDKLTRSLAEVQRLSKELEKAEQVLIQREDSLQNLRETLQKQKESITDNADKLEEHYQALLDDQQRRLDGQEKMLQRLTRSLQDKDRQLQDIIQAQKVLGETDGQGALVDSLKSQLRDKERAVDEAIQDQMKSSEEKEAEIRQLKLALRERDSDLERANQMLLNTEETIDGLEREAVEKDTALRQLASALKAQERALQDAAESHERSLSEKEALIQRLRDSLQDRGQSLQDSLRQSLGPNDVAQHLQQQLEERDQLLQEMLSERSRAAEKHDEASKLLLQKLRAKDDDRRTIELEHQKELAQLSRELQSVQADLNQKELQLQSLETKATWTEESQQERLDKLKATLNEKDRTIESLVDSGREKDRVIRQLQAVSTNTVPQESWQAASRMAEIQQLKDEIALQANTLRNKEAMIQRLQEALERHSPRPDMVPRARLRDAEDELHQYQQDELVQQLETAQGPCQKCLQLPEDNRVSCQKCAELQQEIDELRGRSDRSVIPKRTQTMGGNSDSQAGESVSGVHLVEIQQLTDALRARHDIYVNINSSQNSESSRVFEQELAAVQALKNQLEAGLERNRELCATQEVKGHTTLSTSSKDQPDDDSITTLKSKIAQLQTDLEESQRWNSSLQARLQQQQSSTVRDVGVGGALDPGEGVLDPRGGGSYSMGGVRRPASRAMELEGAASDSEDKGATSSNRSMQAAGWDEIAVVRTAKSSDQSSKNASSLEHWRGASDLTSAFDDSQGASFMPSFLPLSLQSLDDLIPNDTILSRMSQDNLQEVLRSLRQQIQNATLDLHGDQEPSNENNEGGSHSQRLRTELAAVRIEKDMLLSQVKTLQSKIRTISDSSVRNIRGLGPTFKARGSSDPSSDLRSSIIDDNEDAFDQVAALSAQMSQAEAMNNLLRKQIEENSRPSDSTDGEHQTSKAPGARKLSGKESVSSETSTGSSSRRSQIPQLSRQHHGSTPNSATESEAEVETLRTQLTEAKSQNAVLQSTLASTEATVRSQAEKMKVYRRQLESVGIAPQTPPRSRSESNLAQLGVSPEMLSGGRTRSTGEVNFTLARSASLKGINLDRLTGFGQTENPAELQEQVSELQRYIKRYDTAVRNLRGRSRSASSTSSSGSRAEESGRSRLAAVSHIPTLSARSSTGPRSRSVESDSIGDLQTEVNSLKHQLTEARKTNVELSGKVRELTSQAGGGAQRSMETGESSTNTLAGTSGTVPDHHQDATAQTLQKIVQTPALDNATLRRQLAMSQDLTEHLRQNLAELGAVVEGLLGQGDQGQAQGGQALDRTLEQISLLRDQLSTSRDMVTDLSVLVQAPDEVDTCVHCAEKRLSNSSQVPTRDSIESQTPAQEPQSEHLILTNETSPKDNYWSKYLAAQKEIASLQAELLSGGDYKSKYSEVLEEVVTLRAQLESDDGYKTKFFKAQQEVGDLHSQLATSTEYKVKYSQAQSEIAALRAELEEFSKQYDHNQLLPTRDTSVDHSRPSDVNRTLAIIEMENETLLRKVDTLSAKVTQLQDDLAKESKNLSDSEKEKLVLIQKLSRVVQQNKKLKAQLDETQLHRDAMQSEIARLRLDVRMSSERLAGVEMERELLQKELSNNRDVNVELQQQLQRMSGDAEDRGQMLHVFQQRLRSRESSGRSHDLHRSGPSIERIRHTTAESDPPRSILLDTADASELDEMLSLDDLAKSGTGSTQLLEKTTSPDSHQATDFNKYLTSASKVSSSATTLTKSESSSVDPMARSLQPATPEEAIPPLPPVPEVSPPTEAPEVNLRSQLEAAEELNATMQEIYDQVTIHETSMTSGLQRSPGEGPLESTETPGDSEKRDDFPGVDLSRHFEEMRLLRQKLEQSIGKNDNLQRMLKSQISNNTEHHVSIHVVESMKTELVTLTSHLQTRTRQMNNLNSEIERLRKELHQKTEELVAMTTKNKQAEDKLVVMELQATSKDKEVYRLEMDVARLKEQLSEKTDLNNTLKMELSTYTKIDSVGKQGSTHGTVLDAGGLAGSLDLGMFLSEFSKLRQTLEKTIDNNNLLREKLEERILATGPSTITEHVNVHHYSTRHTTSTETHCINSVSNGSPPRHVTKDSSNGVHGNQKSTNGPKKPVISGLGGLDDGMKYNITDTQRPPSPSPMSPPCHDTSFSEVHTEQGSTTVRVSSDLRCLYAVGALDDYELLKKQVSEAFDVITSLEAILRPARKVTLSQSPDSSMVRGSLVVLENLQHVLHEVDRLVELFWVSQLPNKDSQGAAEHVSQQQLLHLQQQNQQLHKKYRQAKDLLQTFTEQLNEQNNRKEMAVNTVCERLEETHAVMVKAKKNLAQKIAH